LFGDLDRCVRGLHKKVIQGLCFDHYARTNKNNISTNSIVLSEMKNRLNDILLELRKRAFFFVYIIITLLSLFVIFLIGYVADIEIEIELELDLFLVDLW